MRALNVLNIYLEDFHFKNPNELAEKFENFIFPLIIFNLKFSKNIKKDKQTGVKKFELVTKIQSITLKFLKSFSKKLSLKNFEFIDIFVKKFVIDRQFAMSEKVNFTLVSSVFSLFFTRFECNFFQASRTYVSQILNSLLKIVPEEKKLEVENLMKLNAKKGGNLQSYWTTTKL